MELRLLYESQVDFYNCVVFNVYAEALQVLAANGLLEKISVINKDAGLLERGQDLRHLGVNIIIADFFDAGEVTSHLTFCDFTIICMAPERQDVSMISTGYTSISPNVNACIIAEGLTAPTGFYDMLCYLPKGLPSE